MEEIAVHSKKKHEKMKELGIEIVRIEERRGTNLKVFIYEKTEEVLGVLNNANIQKFY